MDDLKAKKIDDLLKRQKKYTKKLEKLWKDFRGDKDNEDSWGGHDGPVLMQVQEDIEITTRFLSEIERDLLKLNYKGKQS